MATTRPAAHADDGDAQRRQQPDVRRTQGAARPSTVSPARMSSPGWRTSRRARRVTAMRTLSVVLFGVLDAHHRVGAVGHRRAGHDLGRRARR